MTLLRMNIALNLVGKAKMVLLEFPSMALHYTGAKQFLTEARTSGNYGILTGYVLVPTEKTHDIMQLSGTAGIFFQRLASDGPAPEVDWMEPLKDEKASTYLTRALARAKELGICLTYRRRGGACMCIVVDKLIRKFRTWELWGVPHWRC